MDRTAWIAIVLCAVALVLWQVYVVKQTQPPPRPASAGISVTPAPSASASASAASSVAPAASPSSAVTASQQPSPSGPATAFPEVSETLRNGDVELSVTNRGGGIAEALLLNHTAEGDKRVTLNSKEHMPIGAIVENPAAPDFAEYKLARVGEGVQLDRVAGEVTIRKTFSFPATQEKKDNFVVQMAVNLTNNGAAPYSNPGYYVALGSAVPGHANDYATYTRVVWCVNGSAKGTDVGWFAESSGFLGLGVGARPARPVFEQDLKPAEWVAVSDQFFTTLIAPLDAKADKVWARRFEIDPAKKVYGIEGAMRMPGYQLQPGQTYTTKFDIYAGPKLYHRLATLSHNEAEIMEFGMFKIVCQTLLNALNSLHHVLGNYAAAILALTTIVKLILWPIQNKANRSARQMAALSPKMQELREKYKDDPTRMNQEVMKLYKEYGVNPVSGCAPLLIQFPIFIGLFTMLRQAVELRHSSFLWIKDLSQPDTIFTIPGLGWIPFLSTPGVGLPVNILPMIYAASMVWMMKLTPKSGDPTQQRIAAFMPLMIVVFCYNFAAALALYYTTQNLLTILQLYQNRKQPMPKLEKVSVKGKR